MDARLPNEIWDMHAHIVGINNRRADNYLNMEVLPGFFKRALMRTYGLQAADLKDPAVDRRIVDHLVRNLNQSKTHRAVVLALDEVYQTNGTRNRWKSCIKVSNEFVAELARTHGKVLFGASIHPYRDDAHSALESAVDQGACLVKWLPSAQRIDLAHPKCFKFYDMLAHYHLPLLCHTGREHTLPGGTDEMNAPIHLTHPLKRGVTVIAGHCGSRAFPLGKDYFHQWAGLTRRYANLYGDISAFGIPLRRWRLKHIFDDSALRERILYGTDFPHQPMVWSFIGKIAVKELRKLSREPNAFDKCFWTMFKAGVPNCVFERAQTILRLHN